MKSTNKNYLSVNKLIELASIQGVTIGAHGTSHCKLTDCNDTELKNEIMDCKNFIEDSAGIPIESMSYPHGVVDQRIIDAVISIGYKFAVSSRFGINYGNVDRFRVSRTEIWSIDGVETFLAKIRGDWDWMRWKI